jgi:hypothetical protein
MVQSLHVNNAMTESWTETETFAEFCTRRLEIVTRRLAVPTRSEQLAEDRQRAARLCDMELTASAKLGHMGAVCPPLDPGNDNR